MYEYLVDHTAELLAPRLGYAADSGEYATLRYGCYVFYLNVLKTLVLIAAALLLGVLPYVAVFALAYCALRLYSFGVHLDHPLSCTVLGLVYYLGSVYVSLRLTPPLWARGALLCGCLALFLRYAPAASKHRPIPARQRGPFRKRSVGVLLCVSAAALLLYRFPAYSSQLVLAAVCQTANLLPATYIILRKEVVGP